MRTPADSAELFLAYVAETAAAGTDVALILDIGSLPVGAFKGGAAARTAGVGIPPRAAFRGPGSALGTGGLRRRTTGFRSCRRPGGTTRGGGWAAVSPHLVSRDSTRAVPPSLGVGLQAADIGRQGRPFAAVLLDIATRRDVDVHVAAFTSGMHADLAESSVVVTFPAQSDPGTVYTETTTDCLFAQDAASVQRFWTLLATMNSASIRTPHNLDFIRRIMGRRIGMTTEPLAFSTSSRSSDRADRVDVADLPAGAALRDSKRPAAGHLLSFPGAEWEAFLSPARATR
ncbi:DUF397 domain-containing protein [Streptomonospora alba]